MKYYILLLFSMVLLFPLYAQEGSSLNIATYNIRIGRGMDGVYDPFRIGAFLLDQDVDIAGIQEVDVNTRRNQGIDTPELLTMNGWYETRYAKTLDFQGGKYGIMMASRYPVLEYDAYDLPGADGEEPRKAQKMVVELPDRNLTLIHSHLTHLSQTGSRPLQIQTMLDLIDVPENVILLGDLNAEPDDKEIDMIRNAGLFSVSEITGIKASTFPSNNPVREIDYIWISPDLKPYLKGASVYHRPFSDHLPLIAFFEFE